MSSTAPNPNYALAGFSFSQQWTFDALLSDGTQVVSRMGTLASGSGVKTRGTIVKIDPATGAVTAPVAAADCNGVLAENCDSTLATVPCLVYTKGKMKADAIIWPAALPHGPVTDALRDFGIAIESVLYRDGLIVKTAPLEEQAQAAKERIEENRKLGEEKAAEEELPLGVAESSWGYLKEEERTAEFAHLINPLRQEEEAGGAQSKAKASAPKAPPPKPPEPSSRPPGGAPPGSTPKRDRE